MGADGQRHVGWFPLAPHEVYVPASRASGNYVRTINTANTSRLNNSYITGVYENRITPTHYANNRAPAVTAVPQSIFTSGQSVGTHAAAVSTALLAEAVVTAAAPAIAPIHQSVLGAAEGHGVVRPPAARANRPVVARTQPPAAPVNFDTQLGAIQANGGRAPGFAEMAQLPRGAAVAHVRIATPKGAVVSASALPHHAGAAAVTVVREPTLMERERALQTSRLPPARHAMTDSTQSGTASHASPSQAGGYASPSQTGEVVGNHSQWARSHPTPQQNPTPQRSQPASIPVYHPRPASEAYAPEPETPLVEENHRPVSRPAPPPSLPAPRPQLRPQSQRHPQTSNSRDSAARAQPESAGRTTR